MFRYKPSSTLVDDILIAENAVNIHYTMNTSPLYSEAIVERLTADTFPI